MVFRSRPASAASPDITPDARFIVDDNVRVTDAMQDGRVLLHAGTARIWVLNTTGARIWDRLSAGLAIDRVADELCAECGLSVSRIRQDLLTFARSLVAARLLHVRGTST